MSVEATPGLEHGMQGSQSLILLFGYLGVHLGYGVQYETLQMGTLLCYPHSLFAI